MQKIWLCIREQDPLKQGLKHNYKKYIDRLYDEIKQQREDYRLHYLQNQNLLNERNEEILQKEEIRRRLEDKILLLEEGTKNKKWWKFW